MAVSQGNAVAADSTRNANETLEEAERQLYARSTTRMAVEADKVTNKLQDLSTTES